MRVSVPKTLQISMHWNCEWSNTIWREFPFHTSFVVLFKKVWLWKSEVIFIFIAWVDKRSSVGARSCRNKIMNREPANFYQASYSTKRPNYLIVWKYKLKIQIFEKNVSKTFLYTLKSKERERKKKKIKKELPTFFFVIVWVQNYEIN